MLPSKAFFFPFSFSAASTFPPTFRFLVRDDGPKGPSSVPFESGVFFSKVGFLYLPRGQYFPNFRSFFPPASPPSLLRKSFLFASLIFFFFFFWVPIAITPPPPGRDSFVEHNSFPGLVPFFWFLCVSKQVVPVGPPPSFYLEILFLLFFFWKRRFSFLSPVVSEGHPLVLPAKSIDCRKKRFFPRSGVSHSRFAIRTRATPPFSGRRCGERPPPELGIVFSPPFQPLINPFYPFCRNFRRFFRLGC